MPKSAAALLAVLSAAALAHAERAPVLAELFTSEGCSSCPPADALLQKLDAQVIVLSEHVDYWNQLGWRDPFSSRQFSLRQEQYARRLGAEVYTPQLVIDGRDAMVGSDAAKIAKSIAHASSAAKFPVRIGAATRNGADAAVTLSIPALAKGRAEVWIAVADESDSSSVSRGENSGRTLTHSAVLRTLVKAGAASRSEGLEQTVRVPVGPAASRIVVFLADSGGAVVGASFAALP
jgi:hypothetical protein